jgi:uncharacterized protein
MVSSIVFFEWNTSKAAENRRKHRVTFVEAATVFDDPLSMTYPDHMHSEVEERYLIIGMSDRQRILVVAHVDEGDTIRIINARSATRRERRFYEDQKK